MRIPDIVARLRNARFYGGNSGTPLRSLEWEAADEIEGLRAEIERLRGLRGGGAVTGEAFPRADLAVTRPAIAPIERRRVGTPTN